MYKRIHLNWRNVKTRTRKIIRMKPTPMFAVSCVILLTAPAMQAAISLTTLSPTYFQNFDALASSGTSTTLPTGWILSESGTSADTSYKAGTGSSNTGDTYSFGSASSSDRALGGLRSGSLVPTFGISFVNNIGSAISSLLIGYTGEQWRFGVDGKNTNPKSDYLNFQFSTDATSLITGNWTAIAALDFAAPVTSAQTALVNGNDAANRTTLSVLVTGLSLPDNSTFWLRWTDYDATGADDGLGIDDFSITAAAVPEPSTFIAGALLALPFGVQGIRYLRNRK